MARNTGLDYTNTNGDGPIQRNCSGFLIGERLTLIAPNLASMFISIQNSGTRMIVGILTTSFVSEM